MTRVGTFFIVVGFLMVIFFAMTYQLSEPSWFLCSGGGVLLLLGLVIAIRYRKAPSPSRRFQMVDKFRKKSQK